jgi:SAM-dependent methyltransferase
MKYPESNSVGSGLYPKLLGSYEREIEAVLERICSTEYTEIVDIGCAEGYYTVGLAMRIKTAKVFAYDINEEAIRLCTKMARINNVSDRLVTGSFCDLDILKSIPLTKKALIISDCEGYEKELFTKESATILAPHDLLIEVHDLIDIEISSYIRKNFEATHEIEVYQSIDDINKARQYDYEELKGFDLSARKLILAEKRKATMEWFYLRSRHPHAP